MFYDILVLEKSKWYFEYIAGEHERFIGSQHTAAKESIDIANAGP